MRRGRIRAAVPDTTANRTRTTQAWTRVRRRPPSV